MISQSDMSPNVKQNLLQFRQQLPIYSVRDILVREIKANSATVIIGETGGVILSAL